MSELNKELDVQKNVFVVHGRNTAARDAMYQFLRALSLHPMEWDEAVDLTGEGAPFVGRVLEVAFKHAQAVIVILTGDDEAHLREKFQKEDDEDYEKKLMPQARQNVIFEAGYAFALSPERTILVQIGQTRPFSDIAGRHIPNFKGTPENRNALKNRLKRAGCLLSDHGVDWLSAGNFDAALST